MANPLNPSTPQDNGFIGDGAAEIRSIKQWTVDVFPAVSSAITKPTDYGTAATTEPTSSDFSQLFTDMDSLVNPSTSNSPVIPQGTVVMWNGDTTNTSAITALNDKGWFLCTGGTAPNGFNIPNLQNMFVKGWGSSPVGATAGGGDSRTGKAVITGTSDNKSLSKNVTIAEANLPQHSHLTVVNANKDDENALTSSNGIRLEYSPGGVDAGYFLRGEGGTPNIGKTSTYGNPSPTALDVGVPDTEFAHEHLLTEYEPSHYVIAYIIYAGVV